MTLQEGLLGQTAKGIANMFTAGIRTTGAMANSVAQKAEAKVNQAVPGAGQATTNAPDNSQVLNAKQTKQLQAAAQELQKTANQYMAKAKQSQQKLLNQYVTPINSLLAQVLQDPVKNFAKVNELEKAIATLSKAASDTTGITEHVKEAISLATLLEGKAGAKAAASVTVKDEEEKEQEVGLADAKGFKKGAKENAKDEVTKAKTTTKITKELGKASNAQAKALQSTGKQSEKQASIGAKSDVKTAVATGHYVQALKPIVDKLSAAIEPFKSVVQQFAASSQQELGTAPKGAEFDLKTKEGVTAFNQAVANDKDLTAALSATGSGSTKEFFKGILRHLTAMTTTQPQSVAESIVDPFLRSIREATVADPSLVRGILGLVQKAETNPNDLGTLNKIRNEINKLANELPDNVKDESGKETPNPWSYDKVRDVIDAYIELVKRTMTEEQVQKALGSSGGEHEERTDSDGTTASSGDLAGTIADVIKKEKGGVLPKSELNALLKSLLYDYKIKFPTT